MASSDPIPSGEITGRALFRLLAAGVLIWLLITLGVTGWFFASTPDPGLMGVAFPFYAWMISYPPGGLLMLVYGGWRALRKRIPWNVVAWGGWVFFLPVILQVAVAQFFLYTQPTTVQHGDEPMMIAAFTGPVFFLLFLAGLMIGYGQRDRPLRRAGVLIMTPPLIGVVVSIVASVVFTLSSSHWQHRADFALHIEHIDWRDPMGLIIDGRLDAMKPVSAGFHAFYEDRRGGTPVASIDFGTASFADGNWHQTVQTLKAGESYPLRLVWPKLETTSLSERRRVTFRLTDGPYTTSKQLLKEFVINVDPDPARLALLEAKLSPVSRGGKMGYANKADKVIIEPRFDWADDFHEGLAVVRIGQLWGYIDQTGATVIPLKYMDASPFSEDLAAVAEWSNTEYKVGYINKTGSYVIAPRFHAGHPFSEGLARIAIDRKEGYIDRTGEIVIEPQWAWAYDFTEGRAAVKVGEKWGFIDRTGKVAIEPRFDALRPQFRDGRAEVLLNEQWGSVDKDGHWTPDARRN